jgi:chromosome segregation ATPase
MAQKQNDPVKRLEEAYESQTRELNILRKKAERLPQTLADIDSRIAGLMVERARAEAEVAKNEPRLQELIVRVANCKRKLDELVIQPKLDKIEQLKQQLRDLGENV